MKRCIVCIAWMLCMVGATVFASGDQETAPEAAELVVAMHSARTDEIVWGIAERIKSEIEEQTDGRVLVRLVGSEVGGERDLLEATSRGEFQIVQSGDMVIANYAPEYGVTSVPFVFPDYESVARAYEGELGERMNEALIANGNMRLIGRSLRGARLLTARNPIMTPTDMEGVKLRVPEIDTWVQAWSSTGALPTPVAWTEVFTALQTGVVDAQENPIAQIYEAKLYEVQDYIMMTEHLLAYFHWCVNEEFFQSLSAADREIVQSVVRDATEWGTSRQDAKSQEQLDEMVTEHGVQVIQPDKEAFFAIARPAIQEISERLWAPEVSTLLAEILDN
ncbi:MAG: TRAP transporter substrate-binding protein [Spirochaetales bacterium]|nr:TRAP transporter substrate-binding protein [Spirochaetales bacterium]